VPCLVYSHAVNTFYYNNYAYCQAGTSLSIVEDTSLLPSNAQEVYLSYGMPGALKFRGLVGVKAIGKNSLTEYLYKNKSYCKFDLETDRPQPEGYCASLWNNNSYLGMSHALIRKYTNNNNKVYLIASGAPRDQLHGIVRFFTIMFDVSFGQVTKHLDLTLTGPHKGSYFGFSMVAVDLNGDKLDDLIVGAPYFSRKYEPNVGAIYVYQNFKNKVGFQRFIFQLFFIFHLFYFIVIKGFTNSYAINFTGEMRSMFGHAISSVGDMDKDGYNDFVVGAPYELNPSKKEDANGNTGAIYIFRGNEKIEKIKLSQKIFASDVKVPVGLVNSISSFGYSLSGGLDMDASGYPDLLVGSLKSDLVILLRTFPVVYVDSFVNKVENLEEIDQKKKECKQDENSIENDLVCFNFELCFQLNDRTQLQSVSRLQMLEYKLEAEPNQTYSRVYFDSNSNSLNSSIRLNTNFKKSCAQINAFIRKDNSDYIRPIKFLVNYKFATNFNDALSVGAANDLNYIKNYPVIHEDFNKLEFEVRINSYFKTTHKKQAVLQ
jgi:integrin alpha 7